MTKTKQLIQLHKGENFKQVADMIKYKYFVNADDKCY